MDRYLLFDLGASNGRAIVANVEDGKVDFDVIHRFENVPVFANEGEFFWDILRIYGEIKNGLVKCYRKYGKVNSMAIDSWGCDFGFIGEDGRLIGNPLHYRDRAQHEYSAELHEIVSEEDLFMLGGAPCNRIMGVYKLFGHMKKNTIEYQNGKYLLMIPDILNYFLTGIPSNEFCNATMTLMVNQKTRQWEPEIPKRLGLKDEFLKPVLEPGTKLGMIKDSVCKELEIEPIMVVVPATHDTASAVAGIPILDTNKVWGFISLGTWGLAGLETDEPMMDPAIVKYEFGNEGAAAGKNLLLKNITGMWIIQQCRARWLKDGEISWDEVVEQSKAAKRMKSVISVIDPRFDEVQPDMARFVSEFCAATGQEVPETIGEVADCVYRSLALEFRASFDEIMSVRGEKMELLHVVGGGTQNKLLCQYIANAMGIPVVAGPTETTAFGNLIFQLMADGKLASLDEGRKLCAENNEIFHYEPQDGEVWEELLEIYKEKRTK